MNHLLTIELVPGMVVAEDVLDNDYRQVLPKGTILDDDEITKLTLFEVLSVVVEDYTLPVPKKEKQNAPETFANRIRNSEEFKEFKKNYEIEIDTLKTTINNVVEKNAKIDVSSLVNTSLQIIKSAHGQFNVIDMLHNMRDYDDSTFAHSLNVGLLSNVMAGWLGLAPAEVEMATACGLLHDIGKLFIPHEIVTKPGKLTDSEYSEIKRHPIEGYQLLKKQNLDDHICNAALMHHERYDGGGYPLGIRGTQIDAYARLVAICDVYDAMTAARCYRGPLCPFHVVEIFEQEGLQKYDVTYVLTFLEHIVYTYMHSYCRLTDGREGEIIMINKDHLSRPLVLCDGESIDLSKELDLRIDTLL